MMNPLETRTVTVDKWEMRDVGDGMSFAGYAAVFNSESVDMGFRETIAPGAFARTLEARNNVRMLMNHNSEKVLGATRSGTLKLSEDGYGLRAEAQLPDTTVGRDVSVLLKRNDLSNMSFGFTVPPGGDTWSEDGTRRQLTEINLFEVSIVAFPAYAETSAQVRAVDVLADRTGEDAAALALALHALQTGSEITRDQAELLTNVVVKMSPNDEPVLEAVPDIVDDQGDVVAALDLLRAKLDLAYKAI